MPEAGVLEMPQDFQTLKTEIKHDENFGCFVASVVIDGQTLSAFGDTEEKASDSLKKNMQMSNLINT